jgi:hypothetical protein
VSSFHLTRVSAREFVGANRRLGGMGMGKRPLGVTVVAILTLLSALVIGFLQLVLLAVLSVGGPGPGSGYSPNPIVLLYLSPTILFVFALVVSVGQFRGGRRGFWYASMILWIIETVSFAWFYAVTGYWSIAFAGYQFLGVASILLVPSPFFYSVGCLIYFQTARVKHYFTLKVDADAVA